MRYAAYILGAAAAAALLDLAPAFADGEASDALPTASDDQCRIEVLPAHVRTVQRQDCEVPVRCLQRVPIYEPVLVPVYETRQVPVYEDVERPTYETYEVPVYRTERVPVWGEREVPVYRQVKEPVTICLWNPFCCEDAEIELWDRCTSVPCGTQKVQAIVDHEERQVECGTRTERRQTGTTRERVLTGHRCEQVQVGTREVRRFVGCELRDVVTQPAATRTVTECIEVPARSVTVTPDGTRRDEPLAGSEAVLSESEYQAALAQAQGESAQPSPASNQP